MNQQKAFVTSLIFALAGMFLVYLYVSNQEEKIRGQFGTETLVVVAAQDINELQTITPEMLTTKSMPNKLAQPGHVKDPQDLVGAVAGSFFKVGEQITPNKVLKRGLETGLSSQVAISQRALSIPISDVTGVTKLIKPGDRVDLIVAFDTPLDEGHEVKTVIQDVHILAIGEMIQSHTPQALSVDPVTGQERATNLRSSKAFGTITVEVTPAEAQQLVYIMGGKGLEIYTSLRNPVDRVVSSIPSVTLEDVMGPASKYAKSRIKAPPPAPPAPPKQAPPPKNPWANGGGSLVQ